ncbi:MAG: tryptophan synthase subunit alpha [Mailhella sp.]|nr:tryptophan synthase subunit alpha [Mailhella sp.]
MHILERKIRLARKSGRLALIPFVTAGFPSRERFWGIVRELDEAGADVIEIGVPFSDPVADGPVVEEASVRALAGGVTLRGILEELSAHRGEVQSGLVLMGYMNPFLQYGLERFAEDAARAGVQGVIVPDLPFEEAGDMRSILRKRGIALIALVGPNTSEERMGLYSEVSEGYVYVVSVMGTTGERGQLPQEVPQVLARTRRAFALPVALGFGLKSPEQIAFLPEHLRPDAAVFGSSLLKHLDGGGSPRGFMEKWTR